MVAMVLLLGNTAAGTTYYVAPNGNDAWSGLLAEANAEQSDGPLASLNGARLKARDAINKDASIPITVMVRGGEYRLLETVVFSPADAGSKESPITYKAYPGEKPIFTGGIKLTEWKKAGDDPEGCNQNAKGRLWICDLPQGLKGKWQITSLYDGTSLLPRARSGELKASTDQFFDGYNVQPKKLNLGRLGYKTGEAITFRRALHYDGADLREWDNLADIEILTSPRNGWLVNYLPLESIDIDNRIATYGIDSTYSMMPNNRYFVENAIDHLDEPGEWVFDSLENRVYLWPTGDPNRMDIRAPYLQEFIRLEGVEDAEPVRFIWFEGITFRHGLRDTWQEGDRGLQHDWEMYDKGNAILRFRHAEDCSVKRCVFEASSGTGVRVDLHGKRIEIADSLFAHLGGTGILLSGYAPGTKDENKNHKITNNYLHHIGTIYSHSPAILIAQSGHNLISHNTVHDLDYNGMVISGCRPSFMTLHSVIPHRREWINSLRMDEIQAHLGQKVTPESKLTIDQLEPLFHARANQIEHNEIYRVMQKLHDGNGIYFSGMGNHNVAKRNYVHDLGGDRGYIRLDDHSGPTTIVENVGVGVRFMFVLKGPCDYRNNFVINCRGLTNSIRTETHLDRCILYTGPSGKPNLKSGDEYIFDDIHRISNSLIYAPRALEEESLGQDLIPEERRGDAEVGMLFADPMFDEEAMNKKIFRFKPESPAERLGIKSIDLSNVGSTLAQ
jgi:hypothetical protein